MLSVACSARFKSEGKIPPVFNGKEAGDLQIRSGRFGKRLFVRPEFLRGLEFRKPPHAVADFFFYFRTLPACRDK